MTKRLVRLHGTLSYKGLTGEAAGAALLTDWRSGTYGARPALGCFALVWQDAAHQGILLDASGLMSLFLVEGDTPAFSFLEAVAAARRPLRLNSDALFEAILTGMVSPPETLFHNIAEWVPGREVPGWAISQLPCPAGRECRARSMKDAAAHLLTVCREVITECAAAANGGGVAIGLSGGYDSRLLLLLARETWSNVEAHTFVSQAHSGEASLAKAIALRAGVPFRDVPVALWPDLTEEGLRANQADALRYWDARTTSTMGTFNDVHTERVRRMAIGTASLGLNGLGGEMFRNRENLPRGDYSHTGWVASRVVGPAGLLLVERREEVRAAVHRVAQKYAALCGVPRSRWIDRRYSRQVYRKVWIPVAAGTKLQAENRVGPSLMPFAEALVSGEALACTKWIGLGGALEAEMIRQLDPAVAEIPSTYGHSFASIPVRTQTRWMLASAVPAWARLARAQLGRRSPATVRGEVLHGDVFEPTRYGLEIMKRSGIPVAWERIWDDVETRDRTLFLAHFLGLSRNDLGTRR